MVVHHPGRLHQGIADGGADELEATLQQVAAHRVGFGGAGRDVREAAPTILFRLAADEAPEVGVEGRFFLEPEKNFRILNRGSDLQAVAHDSGVAEQPPHFARAVTSDLLGAKAIERLAIIFALLENGIPAQSGLGAFENEELEEDAVIVHRHAPFLIVIGDGEFNRRPRTTWHGTNMRDSRCS